MNSIKNILIWIQEQDRATRFDVPLLLLSVLCVYWLLEYHHSAQALESWLSAYPVSQSVLLTLIALPYLLCVFLIRRIVLLKAGIRQANTDGLVGILNRRKGQELLDKAIEHANLQQIPLSIIMFDIDDFKRINDTQGHHQGDMVLREVSQLLQTLTRREDILIRWGGEEFMVACKGYPLDGALRLAERIRAAIAQHRFSIETPVTASFGVTEYALCEDFSVLLQRVDALLYRSKEAGKNCVTSCAPINRLQDRRQKKPAQGGPG